MIYLILFFVLLLGLTVGSFLNSLIYRLHADEGIWPQVLGGKGKERSFCPKCKQEIAWYDNLPILSFVLLRGKCRHCGKPISWQYPAVELVTGILFVLAVQRHPMSFETLDVLMLLRDWFIIATMIVIFVYDLRWYLILDAVTLPAVAVVFILNLLLGVSWLNLLLACAVGAGFFLIQFVVSKGKWIGGGDIRLGMLMGAALGWPQVLVAIMLAYLIGSVVSVGLIINGKKKWGQEVPFGVFLSLSTIIVLFWGEMILDWYLGIFSF